ncbi:hypothetical protein NDU88_003495 [Pleurodeles waltl]|uniref:Uncharacterized protein n=1 Tax=Pleurodeles waltl TaxID=8319 RepID=A0AAV7VFX9_PLEWA|nr:hypothetical protein NDU88_003495 [Pleurodeles waltl]
MSSKNSSNFVVEGGGVQLLDFAVAPIPGRQVSFSWGEEAGRHRQRIAASPPGRPLFESNQPGGRGSKYSGRSDGTSNQSRHLTQALVRSSPGPILSARSREPTAPGPRPQGRHRGRSSARRSRTGAQSATGPPSAHGAKGAPAIPGQAAHRPPVSRRASGPRGKPARAAGRPATQRGRGRRHAPIPDPGQGHRRGGPIGYLGCRTYPSCCGGAPVVHGYIGTRIIMQKGGP